MYNEKQKVDQTLVCCREHQFINKEKKRKIDEPGPWTGHSTMVHKDSETHCRLTRLTKDD